MSTPRVYLSGRVPKQHEQSTGYCWGADEKNEIISILGEVVFLDPTNRTDDIADSISVFGRDLLQVLISDVVFVDVRERRGIGVGGGNYCG